MRLWRGFGEGIGLVVAEASDCHIVKFSSVEVLAKVPDGTKGGISFSLAREMKGFSFRVNADAMTLFPSIV